MSCTAGRRTESAGRADQVEADVVNRFEYRSDLSRECFPILGCVEVVGSKVAGASAPHYVDDSRGAAGRKPLSNVCAEAVRVRPVGRSEPLGSVAAPPHPIDDGRAD